MAQKDTPGQLSAAEVTQNGWRTSELTFQSDGHYKLVISVISIIAVLTIHNVNS